MNSLRTQLHNYRAFLWHAVFLSITITFTEVNTVIPAMILQTGGNELHVGFAGAIMVGVPLLAQLNFTGLLNGRRRKKPYLLTAINIRVVTLAAIAFTMVRVRSMTSAQALLIIYLELLLFTVSGAFAGVSYVDLIGKSFSRELRRRFFTRKQIVSSVGILLSALIARQVLSSFAYPDSYAVLFGAASAVLFAATGGFWMVREEASTGSGGPGYLKTLASIPSVLRSDGNLRTYLFYLNSAGFHTALLPFYVAFAKQRYHLDPSLAGNLLFFQIAGMVAASLVWPLVVKRGGFKAVLRTMSVISLLLPPAALAAGYFLPLPVYLALFLFTGAAVSARTVSQDAVTVELSGEDNRVLYTGIIGTLNLSLALFPIVLGSLIALSGYRAVFLGVAVMAAVSLLFLRGLSCPAGGDAE